MLTNHIAWFDPGPLGGAIGLHLPHLSRRKGLSEGHKQQRQYHDGEEKIGRRTGRDDRGALTQPLVVKREIAFRRGHACETGGRQARTRIAVTEHLDVAAKRDGAEFPAGSGAIMPAEQLGAKADRKHVDPHTVSSGNVKMPKLVHENEHRKHKQERDDVAQPVMDKRDHCKPTGVAVA